MFSFTPDPPTFSLFLYLPKFMSKISQNQNKRENQNKQTEGKQTNKQKIVRQNKSKKSPQEYYGVCLCCPSIPGHGAFPRMC